MNEIKSKYNLAVFKAFLHPYDTVNFAYNLDDDLEIRSDSISEDVDERMSSNPKLFKSSSMEILTPEEDFIDGATQLDSREDNKNSKSPHMSRISGCNIGPKTLLAKQGRIPLKFASPAGTSTYPTTLLNKGELHCEGSTQNITCRVGQVRVLFCLPDCRFLMNSLVTYNGASGYVAHCHF